MSRSDDDDYDRRGGQRGGRRRDRDDDYDDDYDRPRRRRGGGGSGPPEKGTSALLIAGIVIGALVVVVGGAALLLYPATARVRDSAARMKDQNSLKQIGIGVHSFENVNGKLLPAQDPVSWRVHLLPYIEQENVYRRMDVKQPWDAPVNRQFANVKIPQYVSAADPPETVDTRFRVFVGPNTLYDPNEPPMTFAHIKDGLSNTIFAVETAELVPWPQPKELPYDRNGALPPLGVPGRRGFNVAVLDGSVRFVSDKVSPEVLRGGIDPNDGRFFDPE